MPDLRELLLAQAYDDYWAARNHDQEHRALQRIIALGGNDGGYDPCRDPECVALRSAVARQLMISKIFAERDEKIASITRSVAREC